MSLTSSQGIVKVLEVVGEIFQEENIKICVKESAKGGLIAGVSTLLGGLLGGKTGLLVGKSVFIVYLSKYEKYYCPYICTAQMVYYSSFK